MRLYAYFAAVISALRRQRLVARPSAPGLVFQWPAVPRSVAARAVAIPPPSLLHRTLVARLAPRERRAKMRPSLLHRAAMLNDGCAARPSRKPFAFVCVSTPATPHYPAVGRRPHVWLTRRPRRRGVLPCTMLRSRRAPCHIARSPRAQNSAHTPCDDAAGVVAPRRHFNKSMSCASNSQTAVQVLRRQRLVAWPSPSPLPTHPPTHILLTRCTWRREVLPRVAL